MLAVVGDDPAKAAAVVVAFVQRRLAGIEPVEVAHQTLHAAMRRIVEQVPIRLHVVVPFALLAELAAHEQQLLAGMRPHEAEIGAQIGEALPRVARHVAEQRAFAVDHLVMRSGRMKRSEKA